jgi:hypothetical protein
MADISRSLWDTTQGSRSALLQKYQDYLGGTYDPKTDPTYAPQYSAYKSGLEGQYGVAKSNLMSSMPQGGQLYNSLANLESNRAGDVGAIEGNLTSQIAQQLMQGATSAAFQTPSVSLSGLGQANAGYSNRMSQQMASQGQGKAGLGSGLGSMLGMGLGAAMNGPFGASVGRKTGGMGGGGP